MNPNPEDLDVCVEDLRSVCRDAWREGLLSGCNGNASRRLPAPRDGLLCVTRSGAAKGRLTARDCCLVDARTGEIHCGGPASSELGMHLELYRALPHCGAVLHSHPRRLLALSLVVADQEDFLRLPLFEADVWRARLGFAPALPPACRCGSGADSRCGCGSARFRAKPGSGAGDRAENRAPSFPGRL